MEKIKNYINGELVAPISNQYIDNYNPASGEVYSAVPDSDERDVAMAVAAAEKAFPKWSVMPAEERSRLLLRVAQLIEQNREKLAMAESIDNGKPVWLAKSVDIPRASSNFHFFATAIVHFASEAHLMADAAINYTSATPLAWPCISPWNLPLYLFTWKIAPALAAGNCVVGKPSEITPMTAYRLAELCIEAGLPPGVLNIVHGYGPGRRCHLRASQGSGDHLHRQHAHRRRDCQNRGADVQKLSLEMGGKNPNLILPIAITKRCCKPRCVLLSSIRVKFASAARAYLSSVCFTKSLGMIL
jgi:aminomuconate-semialdehyde/2-hydroxymuconate-6-semialdehyde dehydrogenase